MWFVYKYSLLCILLFQVRADAADTTCDTDDPSPPPQFPSSIELSLRTFNNWAGNIIVPNLWTAIPKTPEEVLTIVNWAVANDYKVRASGFMHNWSPLTVTTSNSTCPKILLVSTREHLNQMKIISNSPNAAVWTQTGVSIEKLLGFLEEHGYGVQGVPAPGDVTVGGVIAVGGHGTGIRIGDSITKSVNGFTYGSLSNLVLSLTAIVWDRLTKKYVLKTFDRKNKDASAMIINLGRTFLTDVTLRIAPNYNLRCVSRVDIPATELFADPSDPNITHVTQTYESFLKSAGRIETIWFAFTDNPWLKIWTESEIKNEDSREVNEPFNYPFADNLPAFGSHFTETVVAGSGFASPAFDNIVIQLTRMGLSLTNSNDIWGRSKNLLLYLQPTTAIMTANGYAVITRRSNVQFIISRVSKKFNESLEEFRKIGQFPINGPLEIRVSGLDNPEDIGVDGASSPTLSLLHPVKGHPELDTAIWIDVLSFPGTPGIGAFMRGFEEFMLSQIHNGRTVIVRPEWSKGWGYTEESAWKNMTIIKDFIPKLYQNNGGWNWAISTLRKYDPFHVFSNDFLDDLLVEQ